MIGLNLDKFHKVTFLLRWINYSARYFVSIIHIDETQYTRGIAIFVRHLSTLANFPYLDNWDYDCKTIFFLLYASP